MSDLKQEITSFLTLKLGVIEILNCWNNFEQVCSIYILNDNRFEVHTHNSFPYKSYDHNLISLPSKFIIYNKNNIFDYFLKNFYDLTAQLYLLDSKEKRYLYPSTFMNNEQVIWIHENTSEIKDFIFFVKNISVDLD